MSRERRGPSVEETGGAEKAEAVTPIERIKSARELAEKSLGRAFEIAGKLEMLTRFAEQHPMDPLTDKILEVFQKFEDKNSELRRGRISQNEFSEFTRNWTSEVNKILKDIQEFPESTGTK